MIKFIINILLLLARKNYIYDNLIMRSGVHPVIKIGIRLIFYDKNENFQKKTLNFSVKRAIFAKKLPLLGVFIL